MFRPPWIELVDLNLWLGNVIKHEDLDLDDDR